MGFLTQDLACEGDANHGEHDGGKTDEDGETGLIGVENLNSASGKAEEDDDSTTTTIIIIVIAVVAVVLLVLLGMLIRNKRAAR